MRTKKYRIKQEIKNKGKRIKILVSKIPHKWQVTETQIKCWNDFKKLNKKLVKLNTFEKSEVYFADTYSNKRKMEKKLLQEELFNI